MAGCTKMPLGMELGLSPGDFVLDGNPAPLAILDLGYCGPEPIITVFFMQMRPQPLLLG